MRCCRAGWPRRGARSPTSTSSAARTSSSSTARAASSTPRATWSPRAPQFEEALLVVDLDVEDDAGSARALSGVGEVHPTRGAPRHGEVAEPLDEVAEVYGALVLGTRDYLNEERLLERDRRAVRRHRLVARRRDRRRRPRPRRRARRLAALAVQLGALEDRRRGPRGAALDALRHRGDRARPRGARGDALAGARRRAEGAHRREPPVEDPRRGVDGDLQRHRRDRAHHGEQVRARDRLLHALRRLNGRVRGDQGLRQDARLRPVPAPKRGGRRARRAAADPGVRARQASLGRAARRPASTRTPCRPTSCSTRSWRPTSKRTAPSPSSSRRATTPALVARVATLVDTAEYKRRQIPPGVRITAKAFGKDRRLPITSRYARPPR